MEHKTKIIISSALLSVLLASCGNNNNNQGQQSKTSSDNGLMAFAKHDSTQQTQQVIAVDQGKIIASDGFVTVPFIINNGKNNTLPFSTNDVYLQITLAEKNGKATKVKKIPVYQNINNATDIHLQMQTNDQLQTFLTFKVGNKYTHKQLKTARIIYIQPNNKIVSANNIPSDASTSMIATNLNSQGQLLNLAKYYQNVADVQQQAQSDNQKVNSQLFLDNEQDANYGNLEANAKLLGKTGSKNIWMKIVNHTNEDMDLPYQDFELYLTNGEEIHVKADLSNYSLYIPHGKTTYVIIPMSQSLNQDTYTIRLSTDGNKFTDTSSTLHPFKWQKL